MRIAFVDLLFSWPPHGGADVDLYHVVSELQDKGHDVHLIGVRNTASWERGVFEPDALPFPASRLEIEGRAFRPTMLTERLRRAVDELRPEAVFVCDGFFLKPYVINALADYPLAARYYAYEVACHRDILRFKEGAPCPNRYLDTPQACRVCALEQLAPDIKSHYYLAWTQEYMAAKAFAPAYHGVLHESLQNLDAAIVYNPVMKEHLDGFCHEVFIVPGGVDLEDFPCVPPRAGDGRRKKAILMTGRGEDFAKGVSVLRQAAQQLSQTRTDFEIRVTMPEDSGATDCFKPIGWLDRARIAAQYAEASVCVVPSLWDEPFGLTALEAMATGRPVCASRVGGLQDIVRHEETGFLFKRGDSAGLAACLARLLDDPALGARMGEAGRRVAELEYTWEHVVRHHYAPILDRLRAAGKR